MQSIRRRWRRSSEIHRGHRGRDRGSDNETAAQIIRAPFEYGAQVFGRQRRAGSRSPNTSASTKPPGSSWRWTRQRANFYSQLPLKMGARDPHRDRRSSGCRRGRGAREVAGPSAVDDDGLRPGAHPHHPRRDRGIRRRADEAETVMEYSSWTRARCWWACYRSGR
jgi:hypothetical protein